MYISMDPYKYALTAFVRLASSPLDLLGRFRTNTHFYPTSFILLYVWTMDPKTSCFINNCNSACIAFFHFSQ